MTGDLIAFVILALLLRFIAQHAINELEYKQQVEDRQYERMIRELEEGFYND